MLIFKHINDIWELYMSLYRVHVNLGLTEQNTIGPRHKKFLKEVRQDIEKLIDRSNDETYVHDLKKLQKKIDSYHPSDVLDRIGYAEVFNSLKKASAEMDVLIDALEPCEKPLASLKQLVNGVPSQEAINMNSAIQLYEAANNNQNAEQIKIQQRKLITCAISFAKTLITPDTEYKLSALSKSIEAVRQNLEILDINDVDAPHLVAHFQQGGMKDIGNDGGHCYEFVKSWAKGLLTDTKPFGIDHSNPANVDKTKNYAALNADIFNLQENQISEEFDNQSLMRQRLTRRNFIGKANEFADAIINLTNNQQGKAYAILIRPSLSMKGHALGVFRDNQNKLHFFDSNIGWLKFEKDSDFKTWVNARLFHEKFYKNFNCYEVSELKNQSDLKKGASPILPEHSASGLMRSILTGPKYSPGIGGLLTPWFMLRSFVQPKVETDQPQQGWRNVARSNQGVESQKESANNVLTREEKDMLRGFKP